MYYSPSQKTTGPRYRTGQGEKILARLASGFVLLLAKSEFYSHLVSWRVVIRTPAHFCHATTKHRKKSTFYKKRHISVNGYRKVQTLETSYIYEIAIKLDGLQA
jgi:hypothetical protein